MENNKTQVLRTRADFVSLKNSGQRYSPSKWLTFYFIESKTTEIRVGYTLSRKVGSAVLRNRLRRWGREFFRQTIKDGLQAGVNINVVFRPMETGFYQKLDHKDFDRIFSKGFENLCTRLKKRRTPVD